MQLVAGNVKLHGYGCMYKAVLHIPISRPAVNAYAAALVAAAVLCCALTNSPQNTSLLLHTCQEGALQQSPAGTPWV